MAIGKVISGKRGALVWAADEHLVLPSLNDEIHFAEESDRTGGKQFVTREAFVSGST